MKGRFSLTCGRPLRRATDVKRENERMMKKKKKVLPKPQRISPEPQPEIEPDVAEEEIPKPEIKEEKTVTIRVPSEPPSPQKEEEPKLSREQLIEMYQKLADDFEDALEKREELRNEDKRLASMIAAEYKKQADLEKEINRKARSGK